ncbi:hypothetical protein QN277_002061 [Acacia crassicarpa]|uniref:Uncharacterized protein n=1 Tax=Acacia crassicarpa TaxID=499986 RepID=A0AAE1N8E4_9FABA|nr:hypothetical protein QN277_002061 [Acacia crassicarpa]
MQVDAGGEWRHLRHWQPRYCNPLSIAIQPESKKVSNNGAGHSREGEDHKEPELCNGSVKKAIDELDSFADAKTDAVEKASEPFDGDASLVTKQTETIGDKEGMSSDKEKRKKEVEDKLQVLNAKNHNLVIALKQILNVEEELKRRTSVQGISSLSPKPGSMGFVVVFDFSVVDSPFFRL